MTLTLAHSDAPLRDQLTRLRECWRKLRRTRWFAERCIGGVYGVEVKHNAESGTWHVHLHAIIDGDYMPQAVLSDLWHTITGDSFIVDIRAVRSRKNAVAYIAAYVTKGSSVDHWPDEAVCEFATAMHGQRLLQSFGTLHGVPLDVADEDDEPTECVVCVSAFGLLVNHDAGNVDAAVVAAVLCSISERFAEFWHEICPSFAIGRWDVRGDPLEMLRCWRDRRVPDPPDRPRIAVQLHLWSA